MNSVKHLVSEEEIVSVRFLGYYLWFCCVRVRLYYDEIHKSRRGTNSICGHVPENLHTKTKESVPKQGRRRDPSPWIRQRK